MEMEKNELIGRCIDSLLAAVGSEVMALSLYRMGDYGEDTKMLVDAMASAFVETIRLQNAIGVEREEFEQKFSERLRQMYPAQESKDAYS